MVVLNKMSPSMKYAAAPLSGTVFFKTAFFECADHSLDDFLEEQVSHSLIQRIPECELYIKGETCDIVNRFKNPVGNKILKQGRIGNVGADGSIGIKRDNRGISLGKQLEPNSEVCNDMLVIDS